jgi:hypothetical protein
MEHLPLVHDLEWSTRVTAKIAQEIPAWRDSCTEIIDLMVHRMNAGPALAIEQKSAA